MSISFNDNGRLDGRAGQFPEAWKKQV